MGLSLWCSTSLQQYFIYIVEVSFIGGRNWNTWRKPLTSVSHWQIYHMMLYRVHLPWAGFEHIMLVVIDTDCIGSCKSNYMYHMITTTAAPSLIRMKWSFITVLLYIISYQVLIVWFLMMYFLLLKQHK